MGNVIQPLWDDCPAITRCVIVGYPAFAFLLSVLGPILQFHPELVFACSLYSLLQLHLWTPFLSVFYSTFFSSGVDFLMLLITLYMAMAYFPARERAVGSFPFLAYLVLANAAMNALFLLAMGILAAVAGPSFLLAPNAGLFPVLMLMMSQRVLADPSGSTSFWGIVLIPNKWYPLCLIGFFSLLSSSVPWSLVAAVAVAYLTHRWPVLAIERFLPTKAFAGMEQRLRAGLLGGPLVPASEASGDVSSSGSSYSPVPTTWGRQQPSAGGGGGGARFTVFSGQGNKLGDGPGSAAGDAAAAAAGRASTELSMAAGGGGAAEV
eukprot:TRINITY_DN16988_c0_g1_i1.p1 TRINITY_DN16988_c0_g1~~TRINITY_DN16988_c0_g1_i1.p1  ORF type:complete len:341 (-),score=59.30 TRINITY_DN16988_c0_g1_i1:21-983(-)